MRSPFGSSIVPLYIYSSRISVARQGQHAACQMAPVLSELNYRALPHRRCQIGQFVEASLAKLSTDPGELLRYAVGTSHQRMSGDQMASSHFDDRKVRFTYRRPER